nr:zinc finger BED domain-containing protein RICESLEEPER 2-like [Tanacetum cinerariifolium]
MTDPTMCSEYERYVNSNFAIHLHPKEFATFDVLGFWKEKETMFPVLSRMAMDLISVQASSVASESAFSTTQAEKDRTLMRLEELRFLATSTKDLDDDDAYWIKKQKRLIKNKMRNYLGDEDDEDE